MLLGEVGEVGMEVGQKYFPHFLPHFPLMTHSYHRLLDFLFFYEGSGGSGVKSPKLL